jgi:hypothetical protein
MIYIAHRGLTDGPDKLLENNPKQVLKAIEQGYHAEVDLWFVNSELFLGHDAPQYLISEKFLQNFSLWIHAKNLAALRWLYDTDFNYFWHQEDDFTLTSKNWIWTYPGKELTSRSIMVMPEMHNYDLSGLNNLNCYGICSDYVDKISKK